MKLGFIKENGRFFSYTHNSFPRVKEGDRVEILGETLGGYKVKLLKGKYKGMEIRAFKTQIEIM